MYPRIVRQIAPMGETAPPSVVEASGRCQCIWEFMRYQCSIIAMPLEPPFEIPLGMPLATVLPSCTLVPLVVNGFANSTPNQCNVETGLAPSPLAPTPALPRRGNLLPGRNAIRPHIPLQRFRNAYAAVGLLIVLQDRYPSPPYRQRAAVQRMYKFRLALALRTIADIRPPRLETFKVRARRNLAKKILSRQPHFYIVSLGRGESYIAGAQRDHSIMQSEFLQHRLGIVSQLLQFIIRGLGTREFHQFNLLKLVLPDNSAHVLTIGTRFAAKTRGIRRQRNRQARSVQHLVAIKIRYRNLRRRNQPKILLAMRHAKQIRRKLWQLPRPVHRLGIH